MADARAIAGSWWATTASCRALPGLALFLQPSRDGRDIPEPGAGDARLDLEDVRRCVDGDGDSYRSLVERHQGRVAAMMWRFSRDPLVHEELVQDVFVEAYRSLRGFRGDAPFAHWLSRIATRVGYRHWRQRERERQHPTVSIEAWDGVLPGAAAPDRTDGWTPGEAAEWIHHLLGQLPARDRLVLTLRFLDDLSVEETAQRTGWSTTMVKVQTWRARRKLEAAAEREREGGAS